MYPTILCNHKTASNTCCFQKLALLTWFFPSDMRSASEPYVSRRNPSPVCSFHFFTSGERSFELVPKKNVGPRHPWWLSSSWNRKFKNAIFMHPWKLTWNPKMTRTCHNPKNWRDCGLPRVIHSQWNLPSNKWPILELDMKAWELRRPGAYCDCLLPRHEPNILFLGKWSRQWVSHAVRYSSKAWSHWLLQ